MSVIRDKHPFSLGCLEREKSFRSISSSFISFVGGRVGRDGLELSALGGRLSALRILYRCRPRISFSSLAFGFLYNFRRFLLRRGCRQGAVTGRVGRLGECIGLTVGGSLFRLRGCPFHGCGVGCVRDGHNRLAPRRLKELRGVTPGLRQALEQALSVFLFDYCAKLHFSSVIGVQPSGFRLVSSGL